MATTRTSADVDRYLLGQVGPPVRADGEPAAPPDAPAAPDPVRPVAGWRPGWVPSPVAVIAAVVVLGLLVGAATFTVVRPAPPAADAAPVAAVRPSPVPLPVPPPAPVQRVRVPMALDGRDADLAASRITAADLLADVVDESGRPTWPGEAVVVAVSPPGGTLVPTGTAVQVIVTRPTPTPVPTPSAVPSPLPASAAPTAPAVVLEAGSPAGSGCTPGAGALPDGRWVGYVTAVAAEALDLDLVCYDSATGEVTNTSSAARTVPVADDVTATCEDRSCPLGDLPVDDPVVLEVAGGAVVGVHGPLLD